METFEELLEQSGEYGQVEEIAYPLLKVRGLPGATTDEILVFEGGQLGQVLALHEDTIEVVVLDAMEVVIGMRVARTDRRLTIPVVESMRGAVIDPLGRTLVAGPKLNVKESVLQDRSLQEKPLTIEWREKITEPLTTGMSVVDLMMPLGKGQRQVVVGDKKTGKTSFLLAAMKTAAEQGIMVIYAAVGKKWSDIRRVRTYVEEGLPTKNTTMVVTSASEVASRIYLTPYAAMAVAEYWRDRGVSSLVVLDDLTTHAIYYRQLALLGKRFPGRESYPGDVFFTHARLLERAGNFVMNEKQVSITCIPVAESVNSDLTGYIVSNLIGITDGHFLFDASVFSEGRRPAIDLGYSVTRVGKQTQHGLIKKLSKELGALMSEYQKAKELSQFGAELSEDTKNNLDCGEKLLRFFTQNYEQSVPGEVQMLLAGAIWQGWFYGDDMEAVDRARARLIELYAQDQHHGLFQCLGAEDAEGFAKLMQAQRAELTDLWRNSETSETS